MQKLQYLLWPSLGNHFHNVQLVTKETLIQNGTDNARVRLTGSETHWGPFWKLPQNLTAQGLPPWPAYTRPQGPPKRIFSTVILLVPYSLLRVALLIREDNFVNVFSECCKEKVFITSGSHSPSDQRIEEPRLCLSTNSNRWNIRCPTNRWGKRPYTKSWKISAHRHIPASTNPKSKFVWITG